VIKVVKVIRIIRDIRDIRVVGVVRLIRASRVIRAIAFLWPAAACPVSALWSVGVVEIMTVCGYD
jgi:hypothetical protein